jgi:glycosyltransferase involved in cell wall biosynthesis
VILFMGRLSHIKGPDLLLSAFADAAAAIPEYDLVFAGPDDGLQASLEREAADRGISGRVHFLGYVRGVEKECAYAAAEFLALPSRREAMSLVALEAGARGKPVLLTDQCGFDDLEAVGGGRLAQATVASLRDGLLQMTADRGLLRTMGQALQRYVGQRYTWSRAAQSFMGLCWMVKNGKKVER